jgi:hypothetical protein
MRKYQPKYRWKISRQQIELLLKVYAFRFVTSDLLAEDLGKDRSTVYERLSVLEQQQYIAKRYDSSYRVRMRPASYCLAPAGLRYLKQLDGIDQATLRNYYKNKWQTEEQIDHCLYVYHIYLVLRKSYGTTWKILTKHEVNREELIRPTPELMLKAQEADCPDYYLELAPKGIMSWILRRRINQHENWADEHDDTRYPHILFVAGNDNTEKRLWKLTEERYVDFKYFITTEKQLLNTANGKVWMDSCETYEDEPIRRIKLPQKCDEQ